MMFQKEKWGKFAFILGISLFIVLLIQVFVINNAQIELNEAVIKAVKNLQEKVYAQNEVIEKSEIIICPTIRVGNTICMDCRGKR